MQTQGTRSDAMSLIEAVVAMTVVAMTATMYSSAFVSQTGLNFRLDQSTIAAHLYLRQVEILRQVNLRNPTGRPFNQEVFNTGRCPPFFYNGARTPLSQLEPAVEPRILLTSTNSFEIPPTSNWVLPLSAELIARGYTISVRAARVASALGANRIPIEERLIKFSVRVDVNDGGGAANLVTGEIFREVDP
jgi:type II secretory pathway pseudopilin PulG